ncbi:subtilisin-like serine protease, partial [Tulasnella sp. 418]
PGIDIFAPGVNIKTTWIGSPTATITLSGTSYSACYVGGLIAYFLGLDPSLTPAAAQAQLHTLGVDGILTSIPSGTNNEIAYNGAA